MELRFLALLLHEISAKCDIHSSYAVGAGAVRGQTDLSQLNRCDHKSLPSLPIRDEGLRAHSYAQCGASHIWRIWPNSRFLAFSCTRDAHAMSSTGMPPEIKIVARFSARFCALVTYAPSSSMSAVWIFSSCHSRSRSADMAHDSRLFNPLGCSAASRYRAACMAQLSTTTLLFW